MEGQSMKTFGAIVEHLRKQAGMTQEQLAQGCSRSSAYISQIESGNLNLSAKVMEEILSALGHELVIGARPKKPKDV